MGLIIFFIFTYGYGALIRFVFSGKTMEIFKVDNFGSSSYDFKKHGKAPFSFSAAFCLLIAFIVFCLHVYLFWVKGIWFGMIAQETKGILPNQDGYLFMFLGAAVMYIQKFFFDWSVYYDDKASLKYLNELEAKGEIIKF